MANDCELHGGYSKCEAWPVDHIENEDQSSPCPKFLFFLHAVLSRPVVDQEEYDQEDQLLHPPESDYMVDSVNVRTDVCLEYDVVMDEERSKDAINKMLSDIGVVPVQAFMVQRILDTALSMSKRKCYVRRKVFRMGVHIEAIVDDLPVTDDDDEDMAELDDDEDMAELDDEDTAELDGEDWEPKFEPANRVSIEELEKVKIEGGMKEEGGCCSVCLDEFESGSEATRMPCSHLFHGDCIVKWLQNSKFCPLCRFQLPS